MSELLPHSLPAPARLPVFHLNMGRAGSVYTASLRAPPSSSRMGQAGRGMAWRGRMPPAVMESVLGVKRILRGPLSYSLSSALRLVLRGKNGDRGAHKWREGERDTIVDARAMPGRTSMQKDRHYRSNDDFDLLKRGGRRRNAALGVMQGLVGWAQVYVNHSECIRVFLSAEGVKGISYSSYFQTPTLKPKPADNLVSPMR